MNAVYSFYNIVKGEWYKKKDDSFMFPVGEIGCLDNEALNIK